MIFLVTSLSVCCQEFEQDHLMVSCLVLMKVLYPAKHSNILTDSYLVNIMEYNLDHQNAPLMEIYMESLRVSRQVLDLDQKLDLGLVTMKALNQASDMGKLLTKHLELWIDSHWVYMMVQIWDLLLGLKMVSLRYCCQLLHLDLYMEYRLVTLKVLNYGFIMGQ